MQAEGLAGQFVLEAVDAVHGFAVGVMQADEAVGVGHVEHDVHVFVDAHGEDEAAVLLVEAGQVGPAAAEG